MEIQPKYIIHNICSYIYTKSDIVNFSLVCKKICHRVMLYMYSNYTYDFDTTKRYYRLSKKIKYMKKIKLSPNMYITKKILKKANNLTHMTLAPLAKLITPEILSNYENPQLKYINMENSYWNTISVINKFKQLKTIHLPRCYNGDLIEIIDVLPNIETLYFGFSYSSDITNLAGLMDNVRHVKFGYGFNAKLSPNLFPNVTHVIIESKFIKNINILDELFPKLETLEIDNMRCLEKINRTYDKIKYVKYNCYCGINNDYVSKHFINSEICDKYNRG